MLSNNQVVERLMDNATVAFFIMDHRQHCTYMNRAAVELTGYTLAEVQGRPLHDVIHHRHPDGTPYPMADCPIDRAFPENDRQQGEDVFVHQDGHFYDVAYTASPLREGGRPVGTVIEVIDISARKRQERASARSAHCGKARSASVSSSKQRRSRSGKTTPKAASTPRRPAGRPSPDSRRTGRSASAGAEPYTPRTANASAAIG